MRFSADEGLSAEVSAGVRFLAEKSEIEQIFWGNARSELSVLVTACWMICLNTNFILLLNCRIFGELSPCHLVEERSLMLIACVPVHLISQTLENS